MKTLHLPLKREYFEQIKAGTKPEEFRLCNDFWHSKMKAAPFDQIVLTMGYPKADDTERRLVLPWRGFTIKTITHPHFGGSPVKVYAIDVSTKATACAL